MRAEVETPCVLCGRPMHKMSHPHWVFDLENSRLKGLAHAGCTNKMEWLTTKRTEWGEEAPTDDQVRFGVRIANIIKMKLNRHPLSERDFHCRMLLHECLWKTSSPAECLSLDRVKELLDWWVNGSKIVSSEQADEIMSKIKEMLEENRT